MANSLRVCIFTETYFPVVGGGETQARLLAEGLVRKGNYVIILTRRTDSSHAKVERYGGITVYRLPPTGRQHLKKWGLLLSSFPALFRLRSQYDFLLVSGFRVVGVSAVLMSKILHKCCLLKADNNGEMSGAFFKGGLEKVGWKLNSAFFNSCLGLRNLILRNADGFIAISAQIAEELATHGIQVDDKIHCIPNSVNTEIFHPVSCSERRRLRGLLGLPDKEILVIYTGRLVSYKGLPHLLKVWKDLSRKYRNAGLVLVGGGSLDIYNCENELKAYVFENELQESVFFSGEVRNVHEYLQAANLFVFPTEKEAFGISVIEAMACGLPVVATAVGGLKNILQDGQNGLVVEPADKNGLFQALEMLITDQERARELAQAAIQTARADYDAEIVTEKYMKLFNRVRLEKSQQQ